MASKIDFLFYSPEIERKQALDGVESLHAVKVLRKKAGDVIQVTDGIGGWFTCKITLPNPKSCEVSILEKTIDYQKPDREVFIAICPTKNSDRIEYFLEKGIEIGLSGVYFIKTQNTYPKKINNERLEKIAVSAMKQSLKAYKPIISDYLDFKTFIQMAKHDFDHKFIAHLDENSEDIINVDLSNRVLLMVGPEGDFSQEELKMAHESGFKNITLGKSRLRTETAGVFAVSILNARK